MKIENHEEAEETVRTAPQLIRFLDKLIENPDRKITFSDRSLIIKDLGKWEETLKMDIENLGQVTPINKTMEDDIVISVANKQQAISNIQFIRSRIFSNKPTAMQRFTDSLRSAIGISRAEKKRKTAKQLRDYLMADPLHYGIELRSHSGDGQATKQAPVLA